MPDLNTGEQGRREQASASPGPWRGAGQEQCLGEGEDGRGAGHLEGCCKGGNRNLLTKEKEKIGTAGGDQLG